MDFTRGSNRELISAAAADTLRLAGALVEDTRRERPRWFDGRFLAARDLIREQQYFLAREADLGRAAGSGVAAGLDVRQGTNAQSLRVGSGHGITPSGELVLLERPLDLNLSDLPRAERLSGQFGLGRIPTPPLRSRNGLFALALRPVEFSANPVGAYPTSITGQRTVEDGDIVEATAVVLVPWPDEGGEGTLDQRRGRVAREIFVENSQRGLSANLLPLAMIALENNTVAWIDVPMLRRELGADRDDLPGLGLAPRALRFAHLQQHQAHMSDVLAENGSRGFPAATVFPALPPAGPLPPGVIDPSDFTQRYFPAEVAVDFSIIPEDELPALIEESLALPGFDLTAADETLESSSVLILAPVPRNQWRAVLARLRTLTRAVQPAASNRIAARKPLEILQRLRLPRIAAVALDPTSPSDAEWQRLARLNTLWFVRRRNLSYRDDAAGTALRLVGRETLMDPKLLSKLNQLGLRRVFDETIERATPAARGEITQLLAQPRIAESPAFMAATLGELSRAKTLDHTAALEASAVLTAPNAGAGLSRLDGAGLTDTPEALGKIAANSEWTTLDREARLTPVSRLSALSQRLDSVPVKPVPNVPIRPKPVPLPQPAPTPVDEQPEPKPAPKPEPAPAPAPVPIVERPEPKPTPKPTPKPEPTPGPVPAPIDDKSDPKPTPTRPIEEASIKRPTPLPKDDAGLSSPVKPIPAKPVRPVLPAKPVEGGVRALAAKKTATPKTAAKTAAKKTGAAAAKKRPARKTTASKRAPRKRPQ